MSPALRYQGGHSNLLGNCRADKLAKAGALLLESSSINLGMPLTLVKSAIERKFFRDANLSWVNEESCSIARLIWPSIDKRRTNQLLGLGRNVISITVAMLTRLCVMKTHVAIMQLLSNDFCRECRSLEEEETAIHFLCHCPSLARCRYKLFGCPILVNLTELSFMDVKGIASL